MSQSRLHSATAAERAAGIFAGETPPRKNLTKADAAYAEIRERILSCDLPPGSVIEQEQLAKWLSISITPIREALRRLESEGFVSLRAHSDARVAPVSVGEFRELHDVRFGLEPLAAEQAAVRATDKQLDALRTALRAADSDAGDATQVSDEVALDRSRSFHRQIYAASANYTLLRLLDRNADRMSRYGVLLARLGMVPDCGSPEHERIIDALTARDRERVGDLVREDLNSTFERNLPVAMRALEQYR